jgi:hypothetical protein
MGLARHLHVSVYFYWCVVRGQEVSRISMADEHGQEYFAVIPYGEGAGWVKRKRQAIEVIQEAIAMELPPGEITWEVKDGPEAHTRDEHALGREPARAAR